MAMRTLLVAILLMASAPVMLRAEFIVGVWLNRHVMMKGETAIADFIEQSAARGVTHVMPNFWFHGYVIYPGSELAPQHGDFIGWDPMEIVMRESAKHNVQVWPWGEYGFFSAFTATLNEDDCGWILKEHPDWIVRDREGRMGLVNEGLGVMHFSMNPAHPDARRFLIDLHLDVARRYDVDGINTDRFRYMNEHWGFDGFSMREYRAAKGEGDLSHDDWRRAVITSFAVDFAQAWRAEFPSHPISAAVNPPSMYLDKFQHFDEWVQRGALDYPAPMIYGGVEFFRGEFEKTLAMVPEGTPVLAGIDAGQGAEGFAAQVAAARELGAAGVVIWNDSEWRKMTYSFATAEPVTSPE